jgi:hypothetical protein
VRTGSLYRYRSVPSTLTPRLVRVTSPIRTHRAAVPPSLITSGVLRSVIRRVSGGVGSGLGALFALARLSITGRLFRLHLAAGPLRAVVATYVRGQAAALCSSASGA